MDARPHHIDPIRHPEETRKHIIVLDDYVLGLPSTREQIDEIFDYHLPKFIEEHRGEYADGTVPVVFWAHGGLVSVASGWEAALEAIPWWRANGVYPIYFVWDTGPAATLIDLLGHRVEDLRGEIERGKFDEHVDYGKDPTRFVRDRIWDIIAHEAQGGPIWLQMKIAAKNANTLGKGGGTLASKALYSHSDKLNGNVSLHAVGHSAGAIFHAYFLKALDEQRGANPGAEQLRVKSLQLLAPAISIPAFLELMDPPDGADGIRYAMYSMDEKAETADHVLPEYQGSLLYLIRNALESKDGQELLGLQECFGKAMGPDNGTANEYPLRAFFPDDSSRIWSSTPTKPGALCGALSHGAFPRDTATMQSVAGRILGRTPTPYPAR
ncbi:hypothetical protein [Sinomonas sp. G460-2]|uniref:hypothetical protein n=1 Tax=Sinomonas sp. G460-2 TaxID=3393464 RepID=UPI0039EF4D7D